MRLKTKTIALLFLLIAKTSSATIIEKELDYKRDLRTMGLAVAAYQVLQKTVNADVVDIDSFMPLEYKENGNVGCLKLAFKRNNGIYGKSYILILNNKPKGMMILSVDEFKPPFSAKWQENCITGMENKISDFVNAN